jgi:2-iminobutanoate/2-iminopropanoate deaminase
MSENEPRAIRRVRSPDVPEPADGRFSNCLMADEIAYIAGMTASSGGDVYAQATTIFGKIKSLIESAGGSMADVVKITVYVTDINQRDGVWKARQEHFTGDFPTATMVQVGALAQPGYKVEIDAVAHIGASRK